MPKAIIDPSRLDLSADVGFTELIRRREELAEMMHELRQAEAERKELDGKILAKLGNANSALAADGLVVSAQTVRRPEFTMPATTYRKVTVRHDRRAKRKAEEV